MRAQISLATLAMMIASTAAHADVDRSVLPIVDAPFEGTVTTDVATSTPDPLKPVRAPDDAPNVFLFMSDDVGFAMASTFGGPVPTPNLDRLADAGVRFNQFHTTGICSPTRAALLTGRNHHNSGFGYLADLPIGYPGYYGEFPDSTASIAEILKENGYSTAMFGKTHNVPIVSPAGPFDQWPTGQGFEYFFGLVGGDTDQYQPALFRGTNRLPDVDDDAPMMEKRMADDSIAWVHNQQAAAPDKPFFIYYAPGSTHAPHQAPQAYIERFKGQFDMGWDRMREESFARQKQMGIVPANAQLTARPEQIPSWDSMSVKMKAFSARSMEVAAGMLLYQDEQVGRVLDELERTGEGRNLLTIFVLGDNGASAESGVTGTLNELNKINGNKKEDEDWLQANVDRLGGPMTYPAYPAGWAWAMNTPLRWTKQYTSMLGGIRNGMVMRWNDKAGSPGSVCPQFGHVVDVAPTILDAAGLPAPREVKGVAQKPMDGQSLLPALGQCRPETPRTQYFEMGGKIGLWHDGWFLSSDDGRTPWNQVPPNKGPYEWKLYNLTEDFSQSIDVAAEHPEILNELIGLWEKAAEDNNVYPLDHRFAIARSASYMAPGRSEYEYWGKEVSIPFQQAPIFAGRSFTLDAELDLPTKTTSGVITAIGSHFAGWSLYLDKGRPVFTYAASTHPDDIAVIRADRTLPVGQQSIRLDFHATAPAGPATVDMIVDGKIIGQGSVPATFLTPAGLGETLDIGKDAGVDVTAYPVKNGVFEGEIRHVRINLQPMSFSMGGSKDNDMGH